MDVTTGVGMGLEFLGGMQNSSRQRAAYRQNIRLQREFAQKGIRWRVADAKAAGLHPLAALGASQYRFQPVSIGGDQTFQRLGQAIQRLDFKARHADLEYKRALTENIKAETKLKSMGQADPGTDDLGIIRETPYRKGRRGGVYYKDSEVIKKDAPGKTAGISAQFSDSDRPDGSVVTTISEKMGESMDADKFAQLQNFMYRIKTQLSWGKRFNEGDRSILKEIKKWQPKRSAGKGKMWKFDLIETAWYPGKNDGKILVHNQWLQLNYNALDNFNDRTYRAKRNRPYIRRRKREKSRQLSFKELVRQQRR